MSIGGSRVDREFLSKAKQIREDFRSAVDDLNQRLGDVEERVRQGADKAHESVSNQLSVTRGEIRAYPVTAVSIAAGIGFVLGLALYRRR